MKQKKLLTRWLTGLVILAQVLSSFSAAATAVIQPPALAPLLGQAAAAQAAVAQPDVAASRPNAMEAVAAAPLAAGTASVTGLIYNDYNANGARDTTAGAAIDNGVGGVTVKAYDATNAVVGTATSFAVNCLGNNNPAGQGCTAASTPALGSYTLSLLPNTTALRLELTSLPVGYYPAPQGTSNATSVRFLTTTTSATSNINFGVDAVGEYVPASVALVVPVQRGLNNNATLSSPSLHTLFALNYSTTGTPTTGTGAANKRPQSTRAQTGAVWGVATYGSNYVWSGTHFKRHAPIGPGGLGAIYLTKIDSGTDNAAVWTTIPNAGTNPRGANETTTTASFWLRDTEAFSYTGKIGLGDVDFSAYKQMLYAVNLNDRQLYAIPVIAPVTPGGAPTAGSPTAIPLPLALPGAATGCNIVWVRPFALETQLNKVYAGLTCTGPATSDLRVYVYQMDADTQIFGSAPAFESTLTGYARGSSKNDGVLNTLATWNPWEDATQHVQSGSGQNRTSWSQPLFSDLVFDNNGDLILAIRDRNGDQTGHTSLTIDPANNNFVDGIGAGDLLRACVDAAGGWTMESAGKCGGQTGYSTNNNLGPGGGEFYNDKAPSQHDQTALGSVMVVPGYAEAVATMYDPAAVSSQEGYRKLSDTNGSDTGDTVLTQNPGGPAASEDKDGTYGKSAGLGDIEPLLPFAPIELGNRVWTDANSNGIQDSGEAGISGVVVNLVTITGTLVAAATTDATGNYYFSSATGTSTASVRYGLNLQPNTAYQIEIANATGASQQTALAGMTLAPTNADGAITNDPITDVRDSDGVISGTLAVINYTTGGAGANNHGLDFGFYAYGTIQIIKQTFGGDGAFSFSSADSSFNNLSLTTSGGIASSTVFTKPIGSYVVTENVQASWNLVGLWCNGDTDSGSTFDLATRQATLDLDKGETLVCTFANSTTPPPLTGSGVLTVTKTVNWNGNTPNPAQTFNINIAGPSYPSGHADTITAGASNVYHNLSAGVYTVTETSPGAGWVMTYSVPSGVVNLSTTTVAPTTAGAISGKVYEDFNSNGQIDSSGTVIDVGLAGLTVVAYDPNGLVVGADATDTSGNYSFTPTKPGPYRVELQAAPTGYFPSTHGTGNGTSTQFVTTNGGATNVNFGIVKPCDYCQNDPKVAVVAYARNTAGSTQRTILDFPNSSSSIFVPTSASDTNASWANPIAYAAIPPIREAANVSEVGSTLGLAWDSSRTRLFTSAYMHAYATMRANAIGNNFAEAAIYQIPYVNGVPGTPTLWLDLESLFGDGFAGVYATDPSYPPTDWGRLGNNPNKIGYTGLGMVKLSQDGTQLYVVNLDKLEVLVIPIDALGNAPSSAASIKRFPFPTTDCPAGTWSYGRNYMAALGLGVYPPSGEVYATLTCTGPTVSDLKGLVYAFNPNDPAPSAASMALKLQIPMAITRPSVTSGASGWFARINHPWESLTANGIYYNTNSGSPVQGYQHNQPWLGEPVFNRRADGSYGMVIAERNRGHDAIVYPWFSAGGVLYKVCNATSTASPTWQLESNGVCGTETSTVNWTFSPASRAGANTSASNRFFKYVGIEGSMMLGTLATIPGSVEVMGPGYDNVDIQATYGIAWLSTLTGERTRDNRLQGDGTSGTGNATQFGKSNAYGDIEVLCDPAPLEIGNRVWKDLNGNGVQDPGEPGLANVTVSLQSPTHTVTTNTDANGLYYFNVSAQTAYTLTINPTGQAALSGLTLTQANNQAVSGSTTSNDAILDTRDSDAVLVSSKATIYYKTGLAGQNNHGLDIGFTPPTSGQVAIVNEAPVATPTSTPTNTPTGTSTATNTPTNTPTATDTPTVPTNTPTATFTNTPTNTPTATDTPINTPTNTPTATPTVVPAQFGDRVWIENDDDSLASTGIITPVAGLVITATASNNTVYTTTTNSQGYYSFTVPAGTYTVHYGAVPAGYRTVRPSGGVIGSSALSGNAGSYAQGGNPDANHPQNTQVTVAAGEANWWVDFAFTPPQANLALVKTVDKANAVAGDQVTYSLVLTNHGPDATANVQVTDLLPTGATWVSDSGVGAYDHSTGIWTVSAVAAHQSVTLTITVQVK